jgi:hypothetical protein
VFGTFVIVGCSFDQRGATVEPLDVDRLWVFEQPVREVVSIGALWREFDELHVGVLAKVAGDPPAGGASVFVGVHDDCDPASGE